MAEFAQVSKQESQQAEQLSPAQIRTQLGDTALIKDLLSKDINLQKDAAGRVQLLLNSILEQDPELKQQLQSDGILQNGRLRVDGGFGIRTATTYSAVQSKLNFGSAEQTLNILLHNTNPGQAVLARGHSGALVGEVQKQLHQMIKQNKSFAQTLKSKGLIKAGGNIKIDNLYGPKTAGILAEAQSLLKIIDPPTGQYGMLSYLGIKGEITNISAETSQPQLESSTVESEPSGDLSSLEPPETNQISNQSEIARPESGQTSPASNLEPDRAEFSPDSNGYSREQPQSPAENYDDGVDADSPELFFDLDGDLSQSEEQVSAESEGEATIETEGSQVSSDLNRDNLERDGREQPNPETGGAITSDQPIIKDEATDTSQGGKHIWRGFKNAFIEPFRPENLKTTVAVAAGIGALGVAAFAIGPAAGAAFLGIGAAAVAGISVKGFLKTKEAFQARARALTTEEYNQLSEKIGEGVLDASGILLLGAGAVAAIAPRVGQISGFVSRTASSVANRLGLAKTGPTKTSRADAVEPPNVEDSMSANLEKNIEGAKKDLESNARNREAARDELAASKLKEETYRESQIKADSETTSKTTPKSSDDLSEEQLKSMAEQVKAYKDLKSEVQTSPEWNTILNRADQRIAGQRQVEPTTKSSGQVSSPISPDPSSSILSKFIQSRPQKQQTADEAFDTRAAQQEVELKQQTDSDWEQHQAEQKQWQDRGDAEEARIKEESDKLLQEKIEEELRAETQKLEAKTAKLKREHEIAVTKQNLADEAYQEQQRLINTGPYTREGAQKAQLVGKPTLSPNHPTRRVRQVVAKPEPARTVEQENIRVPRSNSLQTVPQQSNLIDSIRPSELSGLEGRAAANQAKRNQEAREQAEREIPEVYTREAKPETPTPDYTNEANTGVLVGNPRLSPNHPTRRVRQVVEKPEPVRTVEQENIRVPRSNSLQTVPQQSNPIDSIRPSELSGLEGRAAANQAKRNQEAREQAQREIPEVYTREAKPETPAPTYTNEANTGVLVGESTLTPRHPRRVVRSQVVRTVDLDKQLVLPSRPTNNPRTRFGSRPVATRQTQTSTTPRTARPLARPSNRNATSRQISQLTKMSENLKPELGQKAQEKLERVIKKERNFEILEKFFAVYDHPNLGELGRRDAVISLNEAADNDRGRLMSAIKKWMKEGGF